LIALREKIRLVRTSYIQRLTKELIEKYNYTPPIPVDELAKNLGFKIREVSTELDIDAKLDSKNMRIVVNTLKTNPYRRRFSIAHELGHFVLKHDIKPWEFEDPETCKSYVESEADEFAGSLLMPKDFLTSHIKKGVSPAELQSICQVSKEALWVRMNIYRLTKFLSSTIK
jgi:Zn-dependent peptidase ImmA (M78 family)